MDNIKTQGIAMPKLGLGTFRMQGDACRAGRGKWEVRSLRPWKNG